MAEWLDQRRGAGGEASLAIPISGPEAAGTLYVEADKAAGRWRFSALQLAPRDGGPRIDLLAAGAGGSATAGLPPAGPYPGGAL
ncbi:MAG TPA: cytochrome c oxidase assembly factor Coa1 family protein [Thermoanaerobaculia bacterium]|nr:cytochrome c oxidase assembly factor Coa1 family protein [Thermoanaerobaculia bacterium]